MIAFNSEKIQKMIEKKIHHPYLEQYLNKPLIELDKIALLLIIYDDVAITNEHKENHIISIMLVQIALDTHELVTNESESLSDDLVRQLSVLAGDYYSGLYYRTLAEIDEHRLVHTLAKAIKIINEHKMILYKYEINNWNELIDTLKAIESTLLTTVGELYQLSQVDLQYISEVLLVNRLLKEKKAINCQRFSYIQQYVERDLINICESSLMYWLDQTIEQHQKQMQLLQNKSSFTFNKINNMLDNKKMLSAVEEG